MVSMSITDVSAVDCFIFTSDIMHEYVTNETVIYHNLIRSTWVTKSKVTICDIVCFVNVTFKW